MDVLTNYPERLSEVNGIGKRSAVLISKRIKERTKEQVALLKLYNMGITNAIAQKLYTPYEEKVFHILQTNPYQIVKEVRGVGFQTIDKIANKMTFRLILHFVYRVEFFTLMDAIRNNGHICYPKEKLIKDAVKLLDSKSTEATVKDYASETGSYSAFFVKI